MGVKVESLAVAVVDGLEDLAERLERLAEDVRDGIARVSQFESE